MHKPWTQVLHFKIDLTEFAGYITLGLKRSLAMNNNLRTCIASLVVRLTSKQDHSTVCDQAQGKHIRVAGSASSSSVSIYDHERGAHISGSLKNLYDHGSGYHYSGNVSGGSVTIYDQQSGQHYQYTV